MADCKVIYNSSSTSLDKRQEIISDNDSSEIYKSCLDCSMLTLTDCYPSTPKSIANTSSSSSSCSPSSSSNMLQPQCGQVLFSPDSSSLENNIPNQNSDENGSQPDKSVDCSSEEKCSDSSALADGETEPKKCRPEDQEPDEKKYSSDIQCDEINHVFLTPPNSELPSTLSEAFEENSVECFKSDLEFSDTVLDIPDIKSIEEEAAYHQYSTQLNMKQGECELPVLDLELETIINGSFNDNEEYKRKIETTTNEIIKVVLGNADMNNENCMIGSGNSPLPGFNQAFGSTEIGRFLQQKDFIQHAAFTPHLEPAVFTPQQQQQQQQEQQFQQFQMKHLSPQQQYFNYSAIGGNGLPPGGGGCPPISAPMTVTSAPISKPKSSRGGKRSKSNAEPISKPATSWISNSPYDQADLSGLQPTTTTTAISASGSSSYYRRKESRRGKHYNTAASDSLSSVPTIPSPSFVGWNNYYPFQQHQARPSTGHDCCSQMYSSPHLTPHNGGGGGGGGGNSSNSCQFAPSAEIPANAACEYFNGVNSCGTTSNVAASNQKPAGYLNYGMAGNGPMMEQQFAQRPSSSCYSQNWRSDRYYPYGDYSSFQCRQSYTNGPPANGNYQSCLHPQNHHSLQSIGSAANGALVTSSQQQQQQQQLQTFNHSNGYSYNQYAAATATHTSNYYY